MSKRGRGGASGNKLRMSLGERFSPVIQATADAWVSQVCLCKIAFSALDRHTDTGEGCGDELLR